MALEIDLDETAENEENAGQEDELYEHLRLVIDKGQVMMRIDKFLMTRKRNATRTKIQQACEAGNILVNNKAVKSNYKVKPGDVVTALFAYPPRTSELIPENIPLEIVYEDEDIILVNKKPGMVVHPGYGNYSGTLVNALLFHFKNLPSMPSTEGGEIEENGPRPGLIHRIDKNTSGLLILAKNEFAMNHLAKQFFYHSIERSYWALVWGDFEEDSGTIIGNLARSLKNRKVMAVFPDGDYGKHAVTHFKVIERFGYVTLVECKLETGRTHQIRVHMQYIKHPLFNDNEYGGDKIIKGTTFTKYKQFVENCFSTCPRQALHAKSLGFIHPKTQEKLFFETELPADMQELIAKWRNYSKHKVLED